MGMNPETNRLEKLDLRDQLKDLIEEKANGDKFETPDPLNLVRPDGSPVPKHWSIFTVGEKVVIKNYTFEIKYLGETAILVEPVGPVIIKEEL